MSKAHAFRILLSKKSFSFFFFFFGLFRAIPMAYGSSQARDQIVGAAVIGLCHSLSKAGSEPHL